MQRLCRFRDAPLHLRLRNSSVFHTESDLAGGIDIEKLRPWVLKDAADFSAMRHMGRLKIFSPSSSTLPLKSPAKNCGIRPFMRRVSVVLPQPLRPQSSTHCPSGMVRSIFFKPPRASEFPQGRCAASGSQCRASRRRWTARPPPCLPPSKAEHKCSSPS